MSATGLPAFWPMFEPRTPGFMHIDAPDPYRFVNPTPDVSLGVAAANELEEAILREGAGHRRGVHRRAGAGRRRRHRPAAGLLPAHPRDLRSATTCC